MANDITINIDGVDYSRFLDFSLKRDLDDFCGETRLTVNATRDIKTGILNSFPIKDAAEVIMACDGEPILTGYVTGIIVDTTTNQHNISYIINDKTVDLIDNRLDSKQINTPITFDNLIKKVLDLSNIESINPVFGKIYAAKSTFSNKIAVINNAGLIDKFLLSEKIRMRSSEEAYNFINRYADKRQIVVNTDGNGNIVINAIGSETAETMLKNIDGAKDNNMRYSNFSSSSRHRFNKYIVRSMYKKSKGTTAPSVGIAYDNEIRSSRVITIMGSTSLTNAECKKRAEWEANIRKMKSFKYTAGVIGFRQKSDDIKSLGFAGNPLWKINQMVMVQDQDSNIEDEMLIKTVVYNQSADKGSTCDLTLVKKQYYTDSLNEAFLRKRQDKEVGQVMFKLPTSN